MVEIIAAVIGAAATVAAVVLGFHLQRKHQEALPTPQAEPAPAPKKTGRLDLVRSLKRLRCGVVKHPPLAEYTFDRDGSVRFGGYYVELARQVAAANELSIELVPIDWHEFMGDLFTTRDVDLVLSVFETSDRREHGDFTCYFHRIDLCAVVQAESALNQLEDLRVRDLRWSLAKGEAGWEYAMQELGIPSHEAISVEHPNIAAALSMVEARSADVAVVDRLTYEQYAAANPQARIRRIDECIMYFRNAIMVPPKDKEFQEWVKKEFTAVRARPPMLAQENEMLAACHGAVHKYT